MTDAPVDWALHGQDGGKMTPSAQVASYIDAEMLEKSAPDPANMAKIIRNSRRTTFTFPLGEKGHNAIKGAGNYAFFEQIRRKFPSVMISFGKVGDKEDKSQLVVTCPAAMQDSIKGRISRRLAQLGDEDIILPIPPEVTSNELGKFIKIKQGLQEELSGELDKSLGKAENDNRRLLEGKEGKGQWIQAEAWNAANNVWDTNTKNAQGPFRVRIRMTGRAKALTSVVVGRVRAKLIESLGLAQQLKWSGGNDTMEMNMLNPQVPGGATEKNTMLNKRQMLLLTQAKPGMPQNKDQAILLMAHTAIWDAGGSVYGGAFMAPRT
jgi:hypothetical protein